MDDLALGNLKPGLYLQYGAFVKKLEVARGGADFNFFELFGIERVDDDTLASREAWTATALNRRAEWLLNTPRAWMQGDTELEDAPFGIMDRMLLPQLDTALQIKRHGAFLYKVRNNKGLSRLVWLDPDTMTPDLETATHEDGVKRFMRTVNGRRHWISAEDVIWFSRPGMGELESGEAPMEAARLDAEVLYNINRMEDSFFEGNGLPIMLILVPAATSDADKMRLRDHFYNLFNRQPGARQVKTVAVREGVSIEVLSFTPNDMALDTTVDRHRKAVLGVHDVPMSVAMSNASNFATAESDQIQFSNTMATRLEGIAETFNTDPDFQAENIRLEVDRSQIKVLADDVLKNAQAFAAMVAAGLPIDIAAEHVGIELPDDFGESTGEVDNGDGGLITQDRVLNGAQITSAIQIVESFNRGVFDRDVALSMMSTFFNLPRQVADPLLPREPQDTQPEPIPPQLMAANDEIDSREEEEEARLKRWYDNGNYHAGKTFNTDIISEQRRDELIAQYEYDSYLKIIAEKFETYQP